MNKIWTHGFCSAGKNGRKKEEREEEGALSYSIIPINNPRKYLFGDYKSNSWFT